MSSLSIFVVWHFIHDDRTQQKFRFDKLLFHSSHAIQVNSILQPIDTLVASTRVAQPSISSHDTVGANYSSGEPLIISTDRNAETALVTDKKNIKSEIINENGTGNGDIKNGLSTSTGLNVSVIQNTAKN